MRGRRHARQLEDCPGGWRGEREQRLRSGATGELSADSIQNPRVRDAPRFQHRPTRGDSTRVLARGKSQFTRPKISRKNSRRCAQVFTSRTQNNQPTDWADGHPSFGPRPEERLNCFPGILIGRGTSCLRHHCVAISHGTGVISLGKPAKPLRSRLRRPAASACSAERQMAVHDNRDSSLVEY